MHCYSSSRRDKSGPGDTGLPFLAAIPVTSAQAISLLSEIL